MGAGWLEEVAEALSGAVSVLSARRSTASERRLEALAEYINEVSVLYGEYSYLPQVYPVFAVNYPYYRGAVFEGLSRVLEEVAGRVEEYVGASLDVDVSTPAGAVVSILAGTVVLCVEASQRAAPRVAFAIGSARVGVHGYCNLMMHAHEIPLILASNIYVDYALAFMAEALSDYVARTTVRDCR